jgi:hypothetical protein
MTRIAILTVGLVLCAGAPAFAAPDVPHLNVRPTCSPLDRNDKTIEIDTDRCLKTENEAREQLVLEWAKFPAADRALCVQTATITSMESYVDLLTCLEMRRDVAKLPAGRGMNNAPAGLKTR